MHHVLTITSPAFRAMTERARPMLSWNCELVVHECKEPVDNRFGQAGFNRVCFDKVDAILAQLRAMPEDEWLLYTDADVLFFHTAESIIRHARHICDGKTSMLPMVAQHDPDTGPCAGFMAMQNTAAVRRLWHDVASYRSTEYNDQNVVCHMAGRLIHLFPRSYVSSWGNTFGGVWTPDNPQPVAISESCAAWHLNYVVGIEHKLALAEKILAARNDVLT